MVRLELSLIILPVKRDIIFKIFFADERNIEFLTDFLKSALTIPAEEYDEVMIVDPHLIREYPTDKLGIIDVKLKTVTGKTIHIEIQVDPHPHMRERIAYYDAKMITEQIGKREHYKDIKQVISIVISEKEFIACSPNYHHRFTMYDSENRVELTDIVEVHTLELCKIPAEADDSRLSYWMEFIKAEGEIELEAVAQKDKLIKKAVARLMELSADEKTRLLYEAREKERMDIESREDWARTTEREIWQVVVADKEAEIADKDAEIADKDAEIADKDTVIANKEAVIADKDTEIARNKAEIALLRAQMEALIAGKK